MLTAGHIIRFAMASPTETLKEKLATIPEVLDAEEGCVYRRVASNPPFESFEERESSNDDDGSFMSRIFNGVVKAIVSAMLESIKSKIARAILLSALFVLLYLWIGGYFFYGGVRLGGLCRRANQMCQEVSSSYPTKSCGGEVGPLSPLLEDGPSINCTRCDLLCDASATGAPTKQAAHKGEKPSPPPTCTNETVRYYAYDQFVRRATASELRHLLQWRRRPRESCQLRLTAKETHTLCGSLKSEHWSRAIPYKVFVKRNVTNGCVLATAVLADARQFVKTSCFEYCLRTN